MVPEEFIDVGKLKNDYESLRQKYSLPEFEFLEIEFDVERISERGREAKLILRDIRRLISEKIATYLNLFESLMNPSSSTFIYLMLKSSTEEDKKEMREIYHKLAQIQIEAIKLDTIYDEAKEAEFIKTSTSKWAELKIKIYKLIEKMGLGFDSAPVSARKGYFG
jgi:hypothetical protein